MLFDGLPPSGLVGVIRAASKTRLAFAALVVLTAALLAAAWLQRQPSPLTIAITTLLVLSGVCSLMFQQTSEETRFKAFIVLCTGCALAFLLALVFGERPHPGYVVEEVEIDSKSEIPQEPVLSAPRVSIQPKPPAPSGLREQQRAAITIDGFEQDGPLANLGGVAAGFLDGAALVVETSRPDQERWTIRRTLRVQSGRWRARGVPLRDANAPGQPVIVRVREDPEAGNGGPSLTETRSDVVAVPNARVRIVKVDGQDAASRDPVTLTPDSEVTVLIEGSDLIPGDVMWFRILGRDAAGNATGMWPQDGKKRVRTAGREGWRVHTPVGRGHRFVVTAGVVEAPPANERQLREHAEFIDTVLCLGGET
jgi:hypothetical protein